MNAPVESHILALVNKARQEWMQVGALFQRGHEACETCQYCAVSVTYVPYGESMSALPVDAECTLGDPRGTPADCPALQATKEEQEEDGL